RDMSPMLATVKPRLLAPVLVGVCACAPAPTPGDDAGAPDPYAPAASYCESIVDAYCPFYLRCGRLAAADVEECRAIFLDSCEARYEPGYVLLEEEGLLRLRRDAVETCAAHLEDVACAL